MKHLYLTLFVFFSSLISIAQNAYGPEGFNYQAVVRDANGDILANQFISLRFSITYLFPGDETYTLAYQELHDAITNDYGLVTSIIGLGQPVGDAFSALQFGQDEYFLQVEMDIGNGWVDMGTNPLMSVPFAERADIAEDLSYNVWRTLGNDDVDDVYHFIGTHDDEDLVFKTYNTENMRIEHTSGNVGIGTNNPGNPQDGLGFSGKVLHVESPSGSGAVLVMSEADGITNGTNVTQITHSDGNFYMRNHNSDGFIQMAVGTNQLPTLEVTADDVTIGSSNNLVPILNVGNAESGYSRVFLQNSTSGEGVNNGTRLLMNGNNFSIKNLEVGSLALGTGTVDALVIDSDNEVGIGTGLPVTRLHIEDGTDASTTLHGFLVLGSVSSTNTVMDNNEIMARNNGAVSDLFLNGGGGGVVISSTSSTTHDLLVNGTAAKPGGGSWTATSDARLKENVQPYTQGLDEVMEIEPVTYHYIEQTGHNTSVEHVGVIAQDLQKISPNMVSEVEMELIDESVGKYLNVDPSAFTYMLINGMKDQQALIEELQNQNAQLAIALKELNDRLDALTAGSSHSSLQMPKQ